MTKFEAARIVMNASYVGGFFPGDTILLDGDFTAEQLQAVVVLMQVANEDNAQVDVKALAADQSPGDHNG